MKITIQEKEHKKDTRGVLFDINHKPGFYIEEKDLQVLLTESRIGNWHFNRQKGVEFGQKLFELLNRKNGQLQEEIENSRNCNKELCLNLSIPYDLTAIPFEILYYNNFVALEEKIHIIRLADEKKIKLETLDSPLKVLFMAASPQDLKDEHILKFEHEEDLIYKITEKYPLNFQTEDTGSLEGLKEKLDEIGEPKVDVLHISGHAGHDPVLGPVFYMEDEFGNLDKVTPGRLYREIEDFCPRVLFLSGCSTGKSDKFIGVESFAYQVVKKGVSIVLSWGLPVSDSEATKFASVFYEKLAKGKSLNYSINKARLELQDKHSTWPLMRLFTNGIETGKLVESGQKKSKRTIRKIIHKNLEYSNVKVMEQGFVGRRRELQKSISVLKNKDPYKDKYGLIIRGPAGVGKSCLAGRIFERQSNYDIIVLRGKLEQEIIIPTLKKYFDRKGYNNALDILGSEKNYKEKIKELYRTIFRDKNLIIYFDDFEDNLELKGDGYYLKSQYINNFRPFLQYIDYAENLSKIVITSRHPFDLQAEGANLSKKFLVEVPLISFTGADENKKLGELEHTAKSKNIQLYKKFGHGNPRLMEWLEVIAKNEERYDLAKLKIELKGKEEDYIHRYLADIIAQTTGTEFERFISLCSGYRLPVPADAFYKFGKKELLEKGVDLTLFEKESIKGKDKCYWVMPIIRQQMWNKLSEEDKNYVNNAALQWYDKFLDDNENILYHNEAANHALEVNDVDLAARHIIPVGNELNSLLYYKEQEKVLGRVVSKISGDTLSKTKENKKQSVSLLLNDYGVLLLDLGDAKKAIEYLDKALEIDLKVYGDKHPTVATDYNNLGLAYKDLGDAKKAIENIFKSLLIALNSLSIQHPNTKIILKTFTRMIIEAKDKIVIKELSEQKENFIEKNRDLGEYFLFLLSIIQNDNPEETSKSVNDSYLEIFQQVRQEMAATELMNKIKKHTKLAIKTNLGREDHLEELKMYRESLHKNTHPEVIKYYDFLVDHSKGKSAEKIMDNIDQPLWNLFVEIKNKISKEK